MSKRKFQTPILKKYGDLPRNQFGRGDGVRLAQHLIGNFGMYKPLTTPVGTIALNNSNPSVDDYGVNSDPEGEDVCIMDPEDYLCVGEVGDGGSSSSIAIVGKGVAFDSGGMNIKTGSYMRGMSYDKTGALIALELGNALKQNKVARNYQIIAPFVENLVSPTALMPDDIISYTVKGKPFRVEVSDTDAEGRLILADGIIEAQAHKATKIMTIATLTGHISYALGDNVVGILGNDIDSMLHIQRVFAEHHIESEILTIRDQHRKALEKVTNKKIADIINCTDSGKAGAQTAAAFLERFIYKDKVKWIHLDIAGFEGPVMKGAAKLVEPIYNFVLEWK